MSVLSLEKISCRPWRNCRLEGIELSLDAGRIHGVVGANGAGKSTLLRCISGEIPAAAGHIELIDRPLEFWPAAEKARHLALLPQQSLLSFPFRVAEVVALSRIPHATGRQRDREIVNAAMGALDIAHMSQRLYTRLSGGEKQRVQLARIIAQVWDASDKRERLLLLDEPAAALDVSHRLLLLKLLRDMARRGCGVVLVMHDFNLLAGVADQITVLHKGRVFMQGTPAQVFTPAMFLEVFACHVHIVPHPRCHYPLVIHS